ncbi:MAG: hypothetical protein MMC33_005967 [Icmadophila ericetorum]|nr:hypothetical protein [Icmadophila ericetorum]
MQDIVVLSFGGSFNLGNFSTNVTGILNPGVYDGTYVDLLPYFDGSIQSSNLNNQPIGINWLDDGGTVPLYNYLNGVAPSLVLLNTSNQFKLFTNLYSIFARLFGCTLPPASVSTPGEMTQAAMQFNFSQEDTMTLSEEFNAKYNVRCSPPVEVSPTQPLELESLCQADTCPLCVPSPDCDAYVNLTVTGPLPISSALASLAGTSTILTATPTPTPILSTNAALSPGAKAGTAIGSITGFLLLITALILCRRGLRNRHMRNMAPQQQ